MEHILSDTDFLIINPFEPFQKVKIWANNPLYCDPSLKLGSILWSPGKDHSTLQCLLPQSQEKNELIVNPSLNWLLGRYVWVEKPVNMQWGWIYFDHLRPLNSPHCFKVTVFPFRCSFLPIISDTFASSFLLLSKWLSVLYGTKNLGHL